MNSPHTTTPARPGLWARLRAAWAALLGRSPTMAASTHKAQRAHAELVDTTPSPLEAGPQQRRDLQPYNPQALPLAREQWQRGDWASLADITLDQLQDHPDRAKLALLAGAAQLHRVDGNSFHSFCKQAKIWGADETMIRRIMIATTLKTISNAQLLAGNEFRSETTNIKATAISNIKIK